LGHDSITHATQLWSWPLDREIDWRSIGAGPPTADNVQSSTFSLLIYLGRKLNLEL